ncbi:MAG: sulfite exporter TauE/SafE family protein [Ilumatobacteraceae bacterium]
MTWVQFAVIAAAVFAASLTQVLSGFGFALLSVPLLTLAIPTKDAVVISTLLGVGVTTWQAIHSRQHTDRVLARRLVIAAYVGMPLGLWVYIVADDQVLRFVLGCFVLIAAFLLWRRIDMSRFGTRLDVGAGFLSGVLNTSLSTNGPPLVFALQARNLSPDVFRATINTVFALSNVMGMTLFVAAGRVTTEGIVAAAIALPALLLGQVVGFRLRRYVHGERFRILVLGLLVVAGLSAMSSALR